MDQVSRPLLIALASVVILAAVWLVALRPKTADVANTPAAPVQAVAKAKQASAASGAANAKLQAATGGNAAAPAQTAAPAQAASAAKPAQAAADIKAANEREAAVVRDIDHGKVVVILFWNPKGADDVATRGVVRELSRHDGKVAVHVIPISRVGQYESITQGVTINQSPTTLVIDRKHRSRTIVGLTERGELTQAVNDALAGRG